MSGDISAEIVGACVCRHRSMSCAYCGGLRGFDGPPPKPPCRACRESIASTSLEELESIAMEAGQSPEQAEATALQMLAVASGALPHSPEALAIAAGVRREWMTRCGHDDAEITESLSHSPPTSVEAELVELAAVQAMEAMDAGGDDDELILVDDEAATEVLDRADVEAAAICAAAAEAIRQYEAGETLEWPDEPDADKMQAAISDIEAGRVRPIAEVIAQLAPIEETWRKTWTECADLLKAVAEKDPAAAAGYVARCRDWLTRAVQYGS